MRFITLIVITTLSLAMSIARANPDAKRLRAAADEHFVAARFETALVGYQRALATWNHPKIHFSIGLCQLELRDWPAAADAFEAALDGQSELTEREVAEARDYLETALARTATIELVNEQGATLFVDGKLVSARAVRVLPGNHVVVAKRDGISTTETIHVAATENRRVVPVLREVRVSTRWAKWKPWLVVGLGVGVGLASVPLYQLQHDRITEAKYVAEGCIGCDRGDHYDALLADADRFGRYGALALGIGGGVALTGLILVAINRPTQELRALPRVSATRDSVSLSMAASW